MTWPPATHGDVVAKINTFVYPSGTPATTVPRPTLVDPRDYGVTFDSVTDDGAAWQTLLAALSSGGGIIDCPAGKSKTSQKIDLPTRWTIAGKGKAATIIQKTANITHLIGFMGASTSSRVQQGGLRDIGLDGSTNTTGPLIAATYADHLNFDRIWCQNNADSAVDATELWDSYFERAEFEWCSGSTGGHQSVILRNSAGDSTNAVHFARCRWESFKDGALNLIGNSHNMHGLYFTDCKMETTVAVGKFIDMTGDVRDLHMDGLYMALVGLNSGAAALTQMISWIPYGDSHLRKVHFYVADTNLVYVPLDWQPSGGRSHVVRDVNCECPTNTKTPTGGLMNVGGTHVWSEVGNVGWLDPTVAKPIYLGTSLRTAEINYNIAGTWKYAALT